MRISDWSSDVCSSDLVSVVFDKAATEHARRTEIQQHDAIILRARARPETIITEVWIGLHHAPAEELVEEQFQECAAEPIAPCEARSEEHTSELQSLMRNSYAVFCLKKKKTNTSIQILELKHNK